MSDEPYLIRFSLYGDGKSMAVPVLRDCDLGPHCLNEIVLPAHDNPAWFYRVRVETNGDPWPGWRSMRVSILDPTNCLMAGPVPALLFLAPYPVPSVSVVPSAWRQPGPRVLTVSMQLEGPDV